MPFDPDAGRHWATLGECSLIGRVNVFFEAVQEMSWKNKSCNTMGIFLDYYDEKMERARAEDAEVAVFSYTGASWAVGPLVDRRS